METQSTQSVRSSQISSRTNDTPNQNFLKKISLSEINPQQQQQVQQQFTKLQELLKFNNHFYQRIIYSQEKQEYHIEMLDASNQLLNLQQFIQRKYIQQYNNKQFDSCVISILDQLLQALSIIFQLRLTLQELKSSMIYISVDEQQLKLKLIQVQKSGSLVSFLQTDQKPGDKNFEDIFYQIGHIIVTIYQYWNSLGNSQIPTALTEKPIDSDTIKNIGIKNEDIVNLLNKLLLEKSFKNVYQIQMQKALLCNTPEKTVSKSAVCTQQTYADPTFKKFSSSPLSSIYPNTMDKIEENQSNIPKSSQNIKNDHLVLEGSQTVCPRSTQSQQISYQQLKVLQEKIFLDLSQTLQDQKDKEVYQIFREKNYFLVQLCLDLKNTATLTEIEIIQTTNFLLLFLRQNFKDQASFKESAINQEIKEQYKLVESYTNLINVNDLFVYAKKYEYNRNADFDNNSNFQKQEELNTLSLKQLQLHFNYLIKQFQNKKQSRKQVGTLYLKFIIVANLHAFFQIRFLKHLFENQFNLQINTINELNGLLYQNFDKLDESTANLIMSEILLQGQILSQEQ